MVDKVTTSKEGAVSAKKKDVDPNDAVNAAIDNLRQAMLDSGIDETTVEAKLQSVKPNESNIVGNFADLQRIGAQLVGETGGIADAVLPPAEPPTAEEEASAGVTKGSAAAGDAEGASEDADGEAGGYESMTKADLQAELDSQDIAYNSADTKADLIARLEEGE